MKYIEGLEPIEKADSLQAGISYHEKLEQLYEEGSFDATDYSKESAMATAYQKYIYPKFKCEKAEEWVEYDFLDGNKIIGRVDGIAEDGRLVEHKTTGSEITEEYEYDLQWDEQLLAYMFMTGAREVYYTICRKPTIRQKKNETDEEFFSRMVDWYDDNTESKIRLLLVQRTDEDVAEYGRDLERIIKEINNCDYFYRNCLNCHKWGRRCEYASVCLYYDPNQNYVEFTKGER